jgi:hypothetical protein
MAAVSGDEDFDQRYSRLGNALEKNEQDIPFSGEGNIIEGKFAVVAESLPLRCEVCHQDDVFDRKTGICTRCNDSNPVETLEPSSSSELRRLEARRDADKYDEHFAKLFVEFMHDDKGYGYDQIAKLTLPERSGYIREIYSDSSIALANASGRTGWKKGVARILVTSISMSVTLFMSALFLPELVLQFLCALIVSGCVLSFIVWSLVSFCRSNDFEKRKLFLSIRDNQTRGYSHSYISPSIASATRLVTICNDVRKSRS